MFKTMDNTEVYDKRDVDSIIENIAATTSQHTSDINQLKTKTNSLENSKASAAQMQDATNRLTTIEQRLTGDENNISEHNSRITALENNSVSVNEFNQRMTTKADSSFAQQTRQLANNNQAGITALNNRAATLESDKVNRSEISGMVQNAVDNIITAKVNAITSDINHIVDNAVDDALEDYDDSNTVDSKISTAIANIPSGPAAMTTAEATALIDQYL